MTNDSNDTSPPAPDPDEAPEPPPRGVRTMGIVRWGLVALAAIAAVWTWTPYVLGQHARGQPAPSSAPAPAPKVAYRCPMHPQIVSDEPGECPICHMALQPFTPGAPPAGGPAASGAGPRGGSQPAGTVPITLSFDRIQSIGVRTAVAVERDAASSLRVTATVAAPEQGAAEVHVRAAGFVERIGARETGIHVTAGQELLGIYSPEVLQAQSELLAAKGFGEQGARTLEAAHERLELLGMAPGSIDEVLRTGRASRVISVVAPASGYVTRKSAVLGSYVTPEMTLYEIVDLSRVYVIADVFQRDIASVRVGTEGRFTAALQPGAALTAKVDLVYPQLNAEARTTRVRMQVANRRLDLRPGQYGYVDFALRAGKVLVVPRDAVIDTGRGAYVFIDEGSGRYAPRTVALGRELEDGFEVLGGLTVGDRVVSSATFLVDSESRLQASFEPSAAAPGAAPSACDAAFDRARYPDKWAECQRCEKQHAGMGSMVDDCKSAIPKPWR